MKLPPKPSSELHNPTKVLKHAWCQEFDSALGEVRVAFPTPASVFAEVGRSLRESQSQARHDSVAPGSKFAPRIVVERWPLKKDRGKRTYL